MIQGPKDLKPIPNWEEQGCFACGAANRHGLQMTFFTDDQRVYSFLKVPETMIGWNRIVHGGVISTILDETMGWAAIYLFKQLGVTKTMTVDFLRPVECELTISAVAGIREKASDTTVVMYGEIFNSDETLCAKATGEFKLIRPKTAVRMGIVGKDYMKTFSPILNFDYDAD